MRWKWKIMLVWKLSLSLPSSSFPLFPSSLSSLLSFPFLYDPSLFLVPRRARRANSAPDGVPAEPY